MKRVLIVEDLFLIANQLKNNIQKLNYACVGIAPNLTEAQNLIQNELPDVAILDIDLNGVESGLDLIPELNRKRIPFIVLSDLQDKETRDRVFALKPSGYLEKPVTLSNLQNALGIALQQGGKKTKRAKLQIRQADGFVKLIPTEDIVYLMADAGGTEIYYCLPDTNTLLRIVDGETLKHFIPLLDADQFVRIHRSYIINTAFVDSFTFSELKLQQVTDKLPIGKTYRSVVNATLTSL